MMSPPVATAAATKARLVRRRIRRGVHAGQLQPQHLCERAVNMIEYRLYNPYML
jgi:hypothetical protein